MDNIIQVDYVDVDKITYYTAVQVAEEIDEPVSTVRGWSGKDFVEELNIKKINSRKCYTKEDIKRLKFIKELRKNNMSINQIKIHIGKNGFKYADYDSGLVNPKDPLGFQALASALSVEVDSKLNIFMDKLAQQVGEMNKQQLERISEGLNEVMIDTLDEKMNEFKTELEENAKYINTQVAITIDGKLENKFTESNNNINNLKESIQDENRKLESKLEEKFVKSTQSIEEAVREFREAKEEFKIATVTNESIKESSKPALIDRIINKFFKE